LCPDGQVATNEGGELVQPNYVYRIRDIKKRFLGPGRREKSEERGRTTYFTLFLAPVQT